MSATGSTPSTLVVGKPGITASLSGGTQEPRTGSSGRARWRFAAAQSFLYDVFVCSAAALDHSSALRRPPGRVGGEAGFRQTSRRIILAVDQSKLGTRAQARMFDLEDIDLLVTDLDPDDPRLDEYRRLVSIA